jgi:hypothetical protein
MGMRLKTAAMTRSEEGLIPILVLGIAKSGVEIWRTCRTRRYVLEMEMPTVRYCRTSIIGPVTAESVLQRVRVDV